ncbi:8-amino-7-oxononanoate synthase [Clostridiaceae bacterium M8S5]|nr:8-amino-7-oxononanoate synthase [Clostridiaceae bacterium M8S5]
MVNLSQKLSILDKNGLYRDCKYICSEQKPIINIDGKNVIVLGSNNYLGLCNHDDIKQASKKAIDMYGVGSGGSRLTTGSFDLHNELEQKIAQFKGTEKALVYGTGYMANIGVISALCNKDWVIFSDKYNHASIVDGCLLSGAKLVRYKHCDIEDLTVKIKTHLGKNNLIVTDGIFSMDGDIAPLNDIVELSLKYNIITMVDDAHGVGVLGENGSGTISHFNLNDKIHIHMGTLSKSIGSIGGYIAGKKDLIDYLRNTSRSFIFTTSLPPASIVASLKAIDIIQNNNKMRENFQHMIKWFRKELLSLGFEVAQSITPIVPIIVGSAEKTVQFSNILFDKGIYIPAIRPPSVPRGTSRLRASLMATHTYEDLKYVLKYLYQYGKKLGVI